MPGQDDRIPFVPQEWFYKQGQRSEFISNLPTIDVNGVVTNPPVEEHECDPLEDQCCDDAMAEQVVRSMEEAANNHAQFRSIRIQVIRECADLLNSRARSYEDQRSEYVRATDGCAMTLRRFADQLVTAYTEAGASVTAPESEQMTTGDA